MNLQELLGYSQRDLEGLEFEQLINFLKTDLSMTEVEAF